MTLKKFNWEETLKSFEVVEKNLLENFDQFKLDRFLKDFHETFSIENGVEKWQIQEARERFKRFLKIIDEIKKDLLLKKATLTENKKKFTKYGKALILKE